MKKSLLALTITTLLVGCGGSSDTTVADPIVKEPVVEDPVVEDPVVEDPIVEDPIVEDPIVEDPIVEDPVVEDPIVEDPIVEDPVVEDPVVEDPVVVEPDPVPATFYVSEEHGVVGTPYEVRYNVGTQESCSIEGLAVDGYGATMITPTEPGMNKATLTCDGLVVSTEINIIPELIPIPDPVLADALTRLGYTIVNGSMDANDVLEIEMLCITGMQGFMGQGDENNTVVNDNWATEDYGVNCAYTPEDLFISDTSGLDYFVNLETLNIAYQHIEEFDLSRLTNLTYVNLMLNPLKTIDLSNNTALTNVTLNQTSLRSIDLSKLVNLKNVQLKASDGTDGYSELPVTLGNGTVVHGYTEVDFSHNTELRYVYLTNNPITELKMPEDKTSLSELWSAGTAMVDIDLSAYVNLRYVILNNSRDLKTLDVTNVVPSRFYTENCPELTEIVTHDPQRYTDPNRFGIWYDDHHTFVLAE